MADRMRREESVDQDRDAVAGEGREGIGRQDAGRRTGRGEQSTKREFEASGPDERAGRAAGEPATGPRETQEPRSAHTTGPATAAGEEPGGIQTRSRSGEPTDSGRGRGRGLMDRLRNAWHRATPDRD